MRGGPPVRVIEDCLNGRRTVWDDPFKPGRNGLDGIEQRIEVNSPLALVILMLGTNDFQSMHQHNASHSAQGIASLVRAIRRRADRAGHAGAADSHRRAAASRNARGHDDGQVRACARTIRRTAARPIASIAAEMSCAFFDAGARHHRQPRRRRASRCRSARHPWARARRAGRKLL